MATLGKIKAVIFLGIAPVLVLLGSACAPASQQAQPTGEAPKEQRANGEAERYKVEVAKQRGGKLVMAYNSAFGNPNDPHLVITATGRAYSMPATNWLLKRDLYDETHHIVGDLAKSWEVSKDGLSYTFKLQEGVKFHNAPPVNGREFTSEDARYSLMRITADPSVTVDKWKARFQRRTDFGKIKSVETPDKYTLVVNLAEPYAPFLDAVAHPGTAVLPKEFVEKFPDKIITEGTVGTGPFIPAEYRNQQITTYKRNPEYWKKDSQGNELPYLDEMAFLYFADIQAELAAFRAGQLDITRGGVKKHSVDTIKKEIPNSKVLNSPTLNIQTLRFNMKFEPFRDTRVRQAIHLALDRHQFFELVGEGVGRISGPVTPIFDDLANTKEWLLSQPGYRKDKTEDLDRAKRLMKEAGYSDGLAFEVLSWADETSPDVMALLSDQLKPLGITMKAELVDYARQWVPRATQGEFQLAHLAHTVGSDVDTLVSAHLSSGEARNYGKYSDPTLDQLIRNQQRAAVPEERKKWVQEVEKRVLEQAPMLFLWQRGNLTLVQPWVHNTEDAPLPGSIIYVVEKAWVEKH